ncbi:MAG: DUF4845 domain-containing protein [Sterolibacteriaceae bacterium]|nr:DUF4845 domain-containing protein [Candidatus Methylophosphatis haderslevensis]
MKGQRGLSFWGFLFVAILAALALLLGFKVTPSVVEYFGIKKAITVVASESQSASVAEIRAAFMRRQAIDDFSSVTDKDLDISKEAGEVIIAVSYQKKIPLFANVSLLIDYDVTSAGRRAAKRVE